MPKILLASVLVTAIEMECADVKYIVTEDEGEDLPRHYRFHAPPGHDTGDPLPLVVAFHGTLSSSRDFRDVTAFNAIADEERFYVVYPGSRLRFWRLAGFEIEPDDLSYADQVVREFMAEYNVDPRRVYAVGFSQGGILATQMVCGLTSPFAALATVSSASLPESLATECATGRLPVLLIQAEDDREAARRIREVNFGDVSPDLFFGDRLSLNFWRARNGCIGDETAELLENFEPANETEVTRYTWPDCADVPVEFYEVVRGGHAWPGGGPEHQGGEVISGDLDASRVIWDFLKGYSLN